MQKFLILLTIIFLSACSNLNNQTTDSDNFVIDEPTDNNDLVEDDNEVLPCEISSECEQEVELAELVDINRPIKSTKLLSTIFKDISCKPKEQVIAEADTYETYQNLEYGFELQIPYSPKWGTMDYKLPVIEIAELKEHQVALSKLIWGQFISDPYEGCTRPFEILITEPRSVDVAMTEFNQINFDDMGFAIEPQTYSYNDFQIAEYIANTYLCQQGAVEVFTPEFNLVFTTGCYSEEFHNQFKQMAESLNLF